MLFDTCRCRPQLPISRRGLLCAGGAGFASTLIATLAGNARTARAQPLGPKVPEVDRVAVRIVTHRTADGCQSHPGCAATHRLARRVGTLDACRITTRQRVAPCLGRFWLYAGDTDQQHVNSQNRSREFRCAGVESWPLRSFRRDGRISYSEQRQAQEEPSNLRRR
jgi:hypothetical protein